MSRVTVYAHFPTGEALLEAAVERAVRRTMTALEAVDLDDGPPVQVLERMLAAAWRHLARYGAMAQAVAEQMSPEAIARTHQAAHRTIGALLAPRPGRRLVPHRPSGRLAGDERHRAHPRLRRRGPGRPDRRTTTRRGS